MTDTQIGSQERQRSQTESASTAQKSSFNDAGTSQQAAPTRKGRRRTEADKFRDVQGVLTDALTRDSGHSDNDKQASARDTATDIGGEQLDLLKDVLGDDTGTDGPISDRSTPDGDGDDADGLAGTGNASSPTTLRETADALGVKVADLYNIEVPLADGETATLGAIKDAYKSKQAADAEIAMRAAELDERETSITTEQRLWAQLGQELSSKLEPGTREALVQRLQQQEAQERVALLRAMPELQDQSKFEAFRDEVVQTLARYGYEPHEIVVSDHRQLLVVRDLARALTRLKQLRDYKPTPKTPTAAKSNGRRQPVSKTKQLVNNARNSKRPSDKTAAVAALINGGN